MKMWALTTSDTLTLTTHAEISNVRLAADNVISRRSLLAVTQIFSATTSRLETSEMADEGFWMICADIFLHCFITDTLHSGPQVT